MSFNEFMAAHEPGKSLYRQHCVGCQVARCVPRDMAFDQDGEKDYRCTRCDEKWHKDFTKCCSHCGASLRSRPYNQCIACEYAVCHPCAQSGELEHEHNAFRDDYYMGSGTPTFMMSYLSGRKLV